VRVSLTGSAIGGVDRFDHPIASFLAVGFAVGLGRLIELDVESSEGRAGVGDHLPMVTETDRILFAVTAVGFLFASVRNDAM